MTLKTAFMLSKRIAKKHNLEFIGRGFTKGAAYIDNGKFKKYLEDGATFGFKSIYVDDGIKRTVSKVMQRSGKMETVYSPALPPMFGGWFYIYTSNLKKRSEDQFKEDIENFIKLIKDQELTPGNIKSPVVPPKVLE